MTRPWISIAIVAMFAAAIASAQPQPPRMHAQRVLAEYLQLTQDQISAWQQIEKDTAATVRPLAEQERDLEQQLRTLLESPSPDPNAAGKLTVQIDAVRDQIKAAHDAAKAKHLALLTAEQKTKFEAFQAAVAFVEKHRP